MRSVVSEMEQSRRPEELTAKGIAKDLAASAVFLLGTGLVHYLQRRLGVEEGLSGVLLLLFEIALICFGLGYVLHSINYLWEQFSYLIERVANSPTWPRIKAAAKWLAGVVRSGVVLALILAVIFLILVVVWSIVLGTLHHMGKEVAPLLEKLDKLFGIQRFTAPSEPELPSPIGDHTVFVFVLGLLILGWVVRAVSFLVQRQVRGVPSG